MIVTLFPLAINSSIDRIPFDFDDVIVDNASTVIDVVHFNVPSSIVTVFPMNRQDGTDNVELTRENVADVNVCGSDNDVT